MGNLIVFYGDKKDIKKIVSKYKIAYNASVYQIETKEKVGFLKKITSTYSKQKLAIKRCNLNLKNYQNIILVTSLWFNKVPSPILRFLEQQTGKINNIIYILYNNNKEDKPEEFDKMDKILNLRRVKSYFVTMNKDDIHVRVYQ